MALVTEDLCFRYPSGAEVLRSVSLGFEDPMTAIIGPNGAGKSTLLRLLGHLQVHRPSRGRVLMDGVELSTMRSVERVRRLAYVSQTPTVSSPLTVREVVGLSRTLLDRSDETVARAIAEVGLEDRSNDRFSELSVGQRQLAAIARAIAQFGFEPSDQTRYLLADEPIASLDPHHAVAIADRLRAMTERGVRCILVIHDLGFARAVADRVLGLSAEGRVVVDGPPEETITEEVLGSLFGCRFERTGWGLMPRYGRFGRKQEEDG